MPRRSSEVTAAARTKQTLTDLLENRLQSALTNMGLPLETFYSNPRILEGLPALKAFSDYAESLDQNLSEGGIDDATWKTISDKLKQHQRNIQLETAAQKVTAASFYDRYDQFTSLLSDEQKKSHFISARNASLRSTRVSNIRQMISDNEDNFEAKRRILYGFAKVPSTAKVFQSGQARLPDAQLDELAYSMILAEMNQGLENESENKVIKQAAREYVKRHRTNMRKTILAGYNLAKKTSHARAELATQTLNRQLTSYGWVSTPLKITDMIYEELATRRASTPTTTIGASQAPDQSALLPNLKVTSKFKIAKDDYEMYEVLTGPTAGGTRQVKNVTLPASLTTMDENASKDQKAFVKAYFASTQVDGIKCKIMGDATTKKVSYVELVVPYSGERPSEAFLEQMKAGLMAKNSVNSKLKNQLECYKNGNIRVVIKLRNLYPQQSETASSASAAAQQGGGGGASSSATASSASAASAAAKRRSKRSAATKARKQGAQRRNVPAQVRAARKKARDRHQGGTENSKPRRPTPGLRGGGGSND